MATHPTLRSLEVLRADRTSYNLAVDQWDMGAMHGLGLGLFPCHYAGLALFFVNNGSNANTICVDESPNGSVWTPVLFSTPTLSGQIQLTLQPLAYGAILFISAQKHVQVRILEESDGGVEVFGCQFPPLGRPGVESNY